MKEESRKRIISKDGEVLEEKIYTNDYKREVIPYKQEAGFLKSFHLIEPPFERLQELGAFYKMSLTVQRYTNMIMVRRKGSAMQPATRKDLQELLGTSLKYVNRFLAEARRKRIIASIRTGNKTHYVINPAYCYNGGGIDPILFNTFLEDEYFVLGLTYKSIKQYEIDTGEDVLPRIEANFPMMGKLLRRR